jgi:hypothetical protein
MCLNILAYCIKRNIVLIMHVFIKYNTLYYVVNTLPENVRYAADPETHCFHTVRKIIAVITKVRHCTLFWVSPKRIVSRQPVLSYLHLHIHTHVSPLCPVLYILPIPFHWFNLSEGYRRQRWQLYNYFSFCCYFMAFTFKRPLLLFFFCHVLQICVLPS